MRRTPPSKVIFSLEIKLFREETNELRICTHYSEAELWSVAWLPVGQSAIGTIIRVAWSPSAAFCQLCAHVRAHLQTNASPVLPARQADAVLLTLLKGWGRPPVGVRCSGPLLSLRIRCERKRAAVKMVAIRQERMESHHCETHLVEQEEQSGGTFKVPWRSFTSYISVVTQMFCTRSEYFSSNGLLMNLFSISLTRND